MSSVCLGNDDNQHDWPWSPIAFIISSELKFMQPISKPTRPTVFAACGLSDVSLHQQPQHTPRAEIPLTGYEPRLL